MCTQGTMEGIEEDLGLVRKQILVPQQRAAPSSGAPLPLQLLQNVVGQAGKSISEREFPR